MENAKACQNATFIIITTITETEDNGAIVKRTTGTPYNKDNKNNAVKL